MGSYAVHSDEFFRKWLLERELGFKTKRKDTAKLHHALYASTKPVNCFDPLNDAKIPHNGGIFNFDFSLDGSTLVAACERDSFLVFDPGNAKLINEKKNAHTDCVNCVRFLDNRVFATCSDDSAVLLWDMRFLRDSIQTLKGHTSWVKNIEYFAEQGILLTSGFDGCVYAWDINRYSDGQVAHERIFHTSGLMRTKLTADGSKLVMTTNGGYIIVIHNLDISCLEKDLQGFKPNMYRLMQLSQSPLRMGVSYNYLFERERNRVEFISDFSAGNDAEVITSLQIHPQGWCALSRNTNSDENSEWTCIHDIQDYEASDEDQSEAGSSKSVYASSSCAKFPKATVRDSSHNEDTGDISDSVNSEQNGNDQFHVGASTFADSLTGQNTDDSFNLNEREALLTDLLHLNGDSSSSDTDSDDTQDSLDLALMRLQRGRLLPDGNQSGLFTDLMHLGGTVVNFAHQLRREMHQKAQLIVEGDKTRNQIHQNKPRLLFFTEEPNVGRGFIKELCFSSDGRVVCSPYGFGIRLLAFDSKCHELSDCVPEQPTNLFEVNFNASHSNVVLTTKFSPTHCMFVSGCLNGKVCFHQPVL